jgi:D-amino peptidase
MGEVGIDAAYCGAKGVPVILVTGDNKVCAEARNFLNPDLPVVTVKYALSRHAARLISPGVTHQMIRDEACKAVKNLKAYKPYTVQGPYEIQVQYMSTDLADYVVVDGDKTQRLDGQTILFRGNDLVTLLNRVFH